MTALALAFVAGLLSILSPCVLPLVPIVLGAAVTAHPLGAVALAAGLAVSFTGIGLLLALAGFGLGIVITQNLETIRQFIQNALHMQLFAAEIYFFTRLPAVIVPHEVVAVVLMALGLSFLATLYPSWRAARLDPVEGLRYE